MTTTQANDWSTIAFTIGVVVICAFMLGVPKFLGGKTSGDATEEPFESGIVGAGGARVRMSAKFYLVSMFFVLFDLEALYLYAWSTAVRETGWTGYFEILVFIIVLLFGLVYIWRIGALDWSPDKHVIRVKAKRAEESGCPYGGKLNMPEVTSFHGVKQLEVDVLDKIPAQLSGKIST